MSLVPQTAFRLLLLAVLPLAATQCASTAPQGSTDKASAMKKPAAETQAPEEKPQPGAAAPMPGSGAATTPAEEFDDLDEYGVVAIADPLERLNRGVFWLNDKMYLVLFRPVSKVYEKGMPGPLRRGVNHAFENIKFPVRLANCLLQGKIKRAGLQTGRFLVDTIAGAGGLVRVSDDIACLADLPDEDTGKTFANWGLGHGFYLVIPFLGPSSLRDGIGLAGDYALNPVNIGLYYWGSAEPWMAYPPSANTLRALPGQLSLYDETVRGSIDPYLSARSAYVQFREEAVKK